MNNKQHRPFYRVIAVFVAGLFLFVLTACNNTPKVLANETMSSRSNKPANVMQPSDLQQREDASHAQKQSEILIEQSKRNLQKHGNYQQQNNNPLQVDKSISERAEDVTGKAGEGIKNLKENLQKSAEEFSSATKAAGRTAKTAANDINRKAQENF